MDLYDYRADCLGPLDLAQTVVSTFARLFVTVQKPVMVKL